MRAFSTGERSRMPCRVARPRQSAIGAPAAEFEPRSMAPTISRGWHANNASIAPFGYPEDPFGQVSPDVDPVTLAGTATDVTPGPYRHDEMNAALTSGPCL
jgi:hypothetical protein